MKKNLTCKSDQRHQSWRREDERDKEVRRRAESSEADPFDSWKMESQQRKVLEISRESTASDESRNGDVTGCVPLNQIKGVEFGGN
jgi:hypothetical protein